jgi:hypothetical protein
MARGSTFDRPQGWSVRHTENYCAGQTSQGTDPDRLMMAILDLLRCCYGVGAWLTGTGL